MADEMLLIALGANLPFDGMPPDQTLILAFQALRQAGLSLLHVSPIYATPCFPAGAGPDYVNAAAAAPIPEGWDAPRTLALLHAIETRFARSRETRWGMRTLDLDLLAFGQTIAPDRPGWQAWHDLPPARQRTEAPDRLILPHPRLQDRAFVLVPLHDVAPLWAHPVTGLTVREMLAALPAADRAEVRPHSPDSTLVKPG
ncbi:2-amino-4-hydroxy-6-hydroxymethyldihydropteridine diphosphokinase [Tabrizicola sp. TH137]|uniref:2-amino-4-hydroxy-6- hydroxymethyldihydropteridine diphosphokinase n=1 Tax=Tabrizicola sp. TH137 TaxID=2067452 RepID=UPI000C7E2777|nr:2-amino-4-hydroxy-6-hydroxymethyldihydropteridine diphosphokinase [Tabrizicola sp. TH137]PLL14212.1 2-amino-4-hydroxy-6-hydroxymethyldihydropteridine diphosphokinase [Tabrizicola sp. TH137]